MYISKLCSDCTHLSLCHTVIWDTRHVLVQLLPSGQCDIVNRLSSSFLPFAIVYLARHLLAHFSSISAALL